MSRPFNRPRGSKPIDKILRSTSVRDLDYLLAGFREHNVEVDPKAQEAAATRRAELIRWEKRGFR